MQSRSPSVRWRVICLVLVGLGFATSGYLLSRSLAILSNRVPGEIDICSSVFGASCDEALLSSGTWQVGIPLAGWGIVFYATLVCLLIMAWSLGEAFDFEATLAALVLAGAGAGLSLVLLGLFVSGVEPFCPLCLVVHVVNFLLVGALKRSSGRSWGQLLNGIRLAGKYLLGGETDSPREAAWKFVGFVTVALVAVVAYQWVFVETSLRELIAQNADKPSEVVTEFGKTRPQEISVEASDPRLGPAEAPIQMVLFSSFQCPGCQDFAKRLSYFTDHFGKDVSIVFKHFPLSNTCNPELNGNQHPRACNAAWAAEAARLQGKFWPYHDALFASGLDASEETLRRIAKELGLDVARFDTDRESEAVKANVTNNVELGNHLGIRATPFVFLNKRRITHLSSRRLDILVHHILGEVGH